MVKEKETEIRIAELEKQVAILTEKLEHMTLNQYAYTVAETSRILGCSISGVYKMIDRGELQTIKCGKTKVLASSLPLPVKEGD